MPMIATEMTADPQSADAAPPGGAFDAVAFEGRVGQSVHEFDGLESRLRRGLDGSRAELGVDFRRLDERMAVLERDLDSTGDRLELPAVFLVVSVADYEDA